MSKTVLVAGATGNLGGKVTNALGNKGAEVRAVVRAGSNPETVKALRATGVTIITVDMANVQELTNACAGVDCVVSALSGFRDVVIDTQKRLLDAAVGAKVPRFIPSDYSVDFTNLVPGQNRNLDMRREFHTYLDRQPIKATTIFNGAFMELLTGDMPLILFGLKRILCWGKPDVVMDFTTTHDVADYVANVALDTSSPRYLHIAGDRLNPRDFATLMTDLTGQQFGLLRPGGIGLFNGIIKLARTLAPGKGDLYPAWQGMQYMRDMMEGRAQVPNYDTHRYPDMHWTTARDFLVSEKVQERV